MAKTPTAAPRTDVATLSGEQNLPAYLEGMQKTGSGLQGLDQFDLIVPRIKLLQKISTEPDTFDAAKPGMFWLNALDAPLGETVDFIVISNRKRFLLMTPIGDSQGILARADDGKTWNTTGDWQVKLKNVKNPVTWEITDRDVRKSGLADYGTSNPDDPDSNPAATLFHEFLVYMPDHPHISPVLLSLARSQVRKAKDLLTKIEFGGGGRPMQSLRFRASIVTETGDEGEYYNYLFVRSGWAEEAEFKACKMLADRYAEYRGADEEGAVREGERNVGGKDSTEY